MRSESLLSTWILMSSISSDVAVFRGVVREETELSAAPSSTDESSSRGADMTVEKREEKKKTTTTTTLIITRQQHIEGQIVSIA